MIELRSGCKINLGLRIGPKRADGFHEIFSIFQPLDFPCDHLRIGEGKKPGLELVCSRHIEGPNILNRAYDLFARASGRSPALKLELIKKIPMGAGLGGGSGNAGRFLLWLNEHCGRPLATAQLQKLAMRLGADVPFFLLNVPCLAEGAGECLTPLDAAWPELWAVLVWPEIHVDTAWAYAAFDELSPAAKCFAEKDLTKQALRNKNFFPYEAGGKAEMRNDLEAPVFCRYPLLDRIRKQFLELEAFQAGMSGSGSTIFGLFGNIDLARRAAKRLRAQYRHVFFSSLRHTGM